MPRPLAQEQLHREWQDLLAGLPPERVNSPRWFSAVGPMARLGVTELFAELEDVRAALQELRAAGLESYAGRYVTTAWTLRDLLAHLASWAREFRAEVETIARGDTFDYAIPYALSIIGPNQWNQAEVEKRAGQTLDQVLDEFDAETTRLQELVLELPEPALFSDSEFPLAPSGDPAALWRGTIAQMALMKCAHDHYHLSRIRHWLARATPAHTPVPQAEPVKGARKGFHTVTPYLVVAGAAQLLDFLKQALSAEEIFRAPRPDGSLQHAEIRIGDSMVEMGDATPQYPPRPSAIHLYVEDADVVYQRALQAGATSLYKPMDQEYGDREAGVKDLSGNHWYIGTHQGPTHIPEGLRSVTPSLHPRDAAQMIDFLKRAFGAEETLRAESPQGAIAHAKVRIGDSILELGEAHGQFQPMPCTIHLYVEDADAVYERALRAGGTSLFEPRDEPYGDRVGGVIDPCGHSWFMATHIRDVPL